MPILRFPHTEQADEDGILAIGGDLHPESLKLAYSQGIFPWPLDEDSPLAWFCPSPRAILRFENVHLSKSLASLSRKNPFRFTIDQAFEQVIDHCSRSPRPGQDGTWITAPMQAAYCEFHRQGFAHSVEAWNRQDQLVGGLYGVAVQGVFAGESMFFKESGASLLALVHLIERLKERGATWMDIQVLTPHLKQLGAEEITRSGFLTLLAQTQAQNLELFPLLKPLPA